MEPLDLTVHAPRDPRAQLAGVVFLPRTIDKARAALPGGNLGAYTMPGFSEMLLDALGIPLPEFNAAVRDAASDGDVAAFVTQRADANAIAGWNSMISQRLPRNGDRAAAKQIFPWLDERPDLTLALDIIAEDDARHFARR